ncbi:MAG: hypothetical protein ACTHMO_08010 [Rhodanobacteraceae bacterium]
MKQTFLKHALWAALFAAGAAMAQDAAISGADFMHGKADAQLAAIGGKAALDGQTVVVTAPTYWQPKVAAKIRAGAHGKPVAIRFSNGFYENVLVRTESAAPAEAAAKPEPKPVGKPEAKPESKVAAKPESKAEAKPDVRVAKVEKPEIKPAPAAAPTAKPVVAAAPPRPAEAPRAAASTPLQAPAQQTVASVSPQSAPQAASDVMEVPQVSHQPAVVPIPTTAIDTASARPAMPESSRQSDAVVRQRMLASLNDGRPAMGSLTEGQLQSGDQVYADGDTFAVVRLEGLQRSLYWLQGPVDLQRVQYMPQADGRYQVTGTIDTKAPPVHRNGGHNVVVSDVPPAGSAARGRLEQRYNNGLPITGSLSAARLQPEDRLLVDGSSIIVARREGNSMARYWLSGSIDLGQTGIQKMDGNVYRVIGNNLH